MISSNSNKQARIDELDHLIYKTEQVLYILEAKRASHTSSDVPPFLLIDIENQKRDLDSLRLRRASLDGSAPDVLPTSLPTRATLIGRELYIADCVKTLHEGKGWGVIIDGVGGIGKTTLAIEIAYRAKTEGLFDAYLFETAKTTKLTPLGLTHIEQNVASLDGFIRSFSNTLRYQDVLNATDRNTRLTLFSTHIQARKALMIFDNLETLSEEEQASIGEFLERLPGKSMAIVTSRFRSGYSAKTIRLDKMTLAEAYQFFDDVLGQDLPRLQKIWRSASTNEKEMLYKNSSGNPAIMRYIAGRIDISGLELKDAIDLLRQGDEDVFAFLVVDALHHLNNEHKKVLMSLAYSDSMSINNIQAATDLSADVVKEKVKELVKLSIINDPDNHGRYKLNDVFQNYIRYWAGSLDSSSKLGRDNSVIELHPVSLSDLEKVGYKTLQYWIDFVEQHSIENGDGNFDVLEKNMQNIEVAISNLYRLTGLPDKLVDKRATQQLVDISCSLCIEDGPLFCLGSWDEIVQIGDMGYQAASAIKDHGRAMILSNAVARVFERRSEDEMANLWQNRSSVAFNKIQDAHALKLGDFIAGRGPSLREIIKQRKDLNPIDNLNALIQEFKSKGDELRELNARLALAQLLHQDKQTLDKAKTEYTLALEIADKLGIHLKQAQACNGLGEIELNLPASLLVERLFVNLGSVFDGGILPGWAKITLGIFLVIVGILAVIVESIVRAVLESFNFQVSKPDPREAKKYFERSLEICKPRRWRVYAAQAEFGLANALKAEGNNVQALAHAKEALMIQEKHIKDPKALIEINEFIQGLSNTNT